MPGQGLQFLPLAIIGHGGDQLAGRFALLCGLGKLAHIGIDLAQGQVRLGVLGG